MERGESPAAVLSPVCRNKGKGLQRSFLIMDLPFMSYATVERALDNATLALQNTGAKMVKLEGGIDQIPVVEALTHHDIPVCAHIGLICC